MKCEFDICINEQFVFGSKNYRSDAFGQSLDITLIGKEVRLHSWPMKRISTFQHDSASREWPQKDGYQSKGRLDICLNYFLRNEHKLNVN